MKLRTWLAVLVPIALVASACSSSPSSGTASKLTIAAVQGVEDAGLKALAPMYKQQKGVDLQIVEAPYDDLYSKLVNAFKANDSTGTCFSVGPLEREDRLGSKMFRSTMSLNA